MQWPTNPFHPSNPTSTINVTNSSVATALVGSTSNMRATVELQNAGSADVFVDFGPANTVTTAVASGYPIMAGQSKLVTIPAGTAYIACISGTSGQTLYVTVGSGI